LKNKIILGKIVNILLKVFNYDIAILIHLKDDKFCEIDIQEICQIIS